jgi:hypothetical protein
MDPTKKPDPESESPAAAEEEVIDLTEVLEEGASETVIEISSEVNELDSLDLKSLLSQGAEPEPEPPPAPKEEKDESLEDLLFSLKETPGEPVPGPEPEAALEPEFVPTPAPEMAVPPLAAAAAPPEELPPQVQAALSEDQIRQIVRAVVTEIAEKLCREMFPEVASQVVAREIAALKKSLEEEI